MSLMFTTYSTSNQLNPKPCFNIEFEPKNLSNSFRNSSVPLVMCHLPNNTDYYNKYKVLQWGIQNNNSWETLTSLGDTVINKSQTLAPQLC